MQDQNLPIYSRQQLPDLPDDAGLAAAGAPFIEAAPEAPLQIDIPRLLRKYGLLAVALIILGAAGGVLAAAYMPSVYKAKALLEIQPLNSSVLKLQALDSLGGDVDLETESRIITGNTLLRAVIERFQLESIPPAPPRIGFLAQIRHFLRIDTGRDIPIGILKDGLDNEKAPGPLAMAINTLQANAIDRTHLIELSCDSTNPETASAFLNALADEYTQQNLQNRMQTVQLTSQWVTQQLEESKNRMHEADEKLQEFIRASGNAFMPQEKEETLADSQLQELQDKLSEAESNLIQKQARYEMIKRTPVESLADVVDDPSLTSYQNQVANLRQEEAKLTTTLTPGNPKVKAIESQITVLQAAAKKATEAVVSRVTGEYETAKRNKELLSKAYADQAARVSAQGSRSVEYNTLKRESDSARQLYNTMLLQANQSNIVGSLPVNNVRLTERSLPPLRPYKPKPPMIVAGGAAAGFALCCFIGFMGEFVDKRVGSPAHARRLLNIPQLGVIPTAEEPRPSRRLPAVFGRTLASTATFASAGADLGAPSTESTLISRNGLLAESFRATLASLMRGFAGRAGCRIVLVTSPGPGEGKTTIAGNLGVAVAETGRRVLVLDADFRRPRVHKFFGVDNTRGLVDLLERQSPVDALRKEDLGVATEISRLFVLPNGSHPENIAKTLYSPRLPELLNRLRREFDVVIIDTAPLLHVADARVITDMVDGVVLVLRTRVTPQQSAMEAIDQLRADKAVIFGTVLNDWKPSKSQLKASYYYSALDSSEK